MRLLDEVVISINGEGNIKAIYSDDLKVALEKAGWPVTEVTRASHVEPDGHGKWSADMSPVNGPVLGGYSTKLAALTAEVIWIKNNVLKGR